MAITKQTVVDQITVTETNIVQWRKAIRIMEDGVEISKSYERGTVNQGDNISHLDAKIQSVCNAAWGT